MDRQNFGRFFIEASCYSMQMQMLDIVCSYLNGEHLKGNDSAMKPLLFLKTFSDVVKNLGNDDLVNAAVRIFETKNALSTLNEKHHMLNLLNSFSKNRSIFAMPIKSLKSKSSGKTTHEVNQCLTNKKNHSSKLICLFGNPYFYSTIQDGCI